MDHYIEIRVLSDPEFTQNMLMNALYNKLHRVLVQNKQLNIGVSFPEYMLKESKVKHSVGSILRLHGDESDLQKLSSENWLTGMNDHIRISKIYPVSKSGKFLLCRRKQVASNAERLRRRYIKRHNISEEEAKKLIPDTVEKKLQLPFLTIKSQSTDQVFRLFIEQIEAENGSKGIFNRYGLSQTATAPKI